MEAVLQAVLFLYPFEDVSVWMPSVWDDPSSGTRRVSWEVGKTEGRSADAFNWEDSEKHHVPFIGMLSRCRFAAHTYALAVRRSRALRGGTAIYKVCYCRH